MNIKPLIIGDLVAKLPIIQGGMGVGVSLSNLAGAVAKCGGIGIISGAQTGYREKDFEINAIEANLRAVRNHIKKAKEIAPKGIIGVNLMVAMNYYAEHVQAAIDGGADLIISGAGLPAKLPKLVEGYNIKIAPIVSSVKAVKVILSMWDRRNKRTADLVVIEGPKAGGHLGFHKENLDEASDNFDTTVVDIIKEVSIYEEKYNTKIPVVVAGGVFDGYDIAKYLKLGANGVQMATRFVATDECDADPKFKEAYVNCTSKDIAIVKSPVGMPGRAIVNEFVKRTEDTGVPVSKCYNCLIPCNPATTLYCITDALINSVRGNLKHGLIFCGENASRINKIVPVSELIDELKSEILKA